MANESSHTRSCAVERGLAWLQVVCENLFSSLFWKQFVLSLFFSESKTLWLSVYKNRVPDLVQILRTFSFQIQANDIDFKDITREEAVLILLSLGDEVNLLCKYGRESKHSIF